MSSHIGFSREFVTIKEVDEQLQVIQCVIQDLQSFVATPESSARSEQVLNRVKWDTNHLDTLEKWTDDMTQKLPQLKNFILPSGGKAASSLHVSRAVCRRAERTLVSLAKSGDSRQETVGQEFLPVIQFLNRLSSYLFMAARICAQNEERGETIYKKP